MGRLAEGEERTASLGAGGEGRLGKVSGKQTWLAADVASSSMDRRQGEAADEVADLGLDGLHGDDPAADLVKGFQVQVPTAMSLKRLLGSGKRPGQGNVEGLGVDGWLVLLLAVEVVRHRRRLRLLVEGGLAKRSDDGIAAGQQSDEFLVVVAGRSRRALAGGRGRV